MSFFKLVKALKFAHLWKLAGWFFRNPPFMFATVMATAETFRISQAYFPYIHGYHNKANAFRHALWNILIAKYCMWFTKKSEGAINWAKRFTDWHEDFSPNEGLARAMDLHNNKIGRDSFANNLGLTSKKYVQLLLDDLDDAIKIEKISSVNRILNHMVYIED